MVLPLLVWVGDGLLKRVLYIFGNEASLGRKSSILHLPLSWLMVVLNVNCLLIENTILKIN